MNNNIKKQKKKKNIKYFSLKFNNKKIIFNKIYI